jgi:hypothetical protein
MISLSLKTDSKTEAPERSKLLRLYKEISTAAIQS